MNKIEAISLVLRNTFNMYVIPPFFSEIQLEIYKGTKMVSYFNITDYIEYTDENDEKYSGYFGIKFITLFMQLLQKIPDLFDDIYLIFYDPHEKILSEASISATDKELKAGYSGFENARKRDKKINKTRRK